MAAFWDPRCDATDYDVPFRTPRMLSIWDDFAEFQLSKEQAAVIASQKSQRLGPPVAIFLHNQGDCDCLGTTRGSLIHWAGYDPDTKAKIQASSSVMVQDNGSLLRVIPDCEAPWTNGDFSNGTARGWELLQRMGPELPSNYYSLTIEAEGLPQNQITDEALETVCWMCAVWMKRWGLTVDDIYRHADWDQTTRCFCPGTYFDTVIARLQAAGLS